MRIKKDQLPKDVLEIIDLYRGKKLIEIQKIKARWACGTHKKHSLYPVCKTEGYNIFYVDLRELIGSADFGEMMYEKLNPRKLFTRIYERDFRIAKVLDRWNKGGYIDPPELCLNHLGAISFNDGRHRAIAAFHLGEKRMPVAIHSSLVNRISQLINLDSSEA